MKIDFHTHTKLAKKMPFSEKYTVGILNQAAQAGLDAICLTEHYNGTDMEKSFSYIVNTMTPCGDGFIYDGAEENPGIMVFPGLEVNAAEGGHFLVIGAMENAQAIYKALDPYLQTKKHPPFAALIGIVKQYPVLFGVSHPYRENSKNNQMPDLPEDLLKQLDFIDLNGKDVVYDKTGTETKVYALAKKLCLPVLAGSDTHQSFQFGCIYNRFSQPLSTIEALREAINKGGYTIEHGENAALKVNAASAIKGLLKEIHALGGDYVSALFDQ